MKKLHKLLAVLLTMILVLECFTVPALATETELETVPEETTISEPEVPQQYCAGCRKTRSIFLG